MRAVSTGVLWLLQVCVLLMATGVIDGGDEKTAELNRRYLEDLKNRVPIQQSWSGKVPLKLLEKAPRPGFVSDRQSWST